MHGGYRRMLVMPELVLHNLSVLPALAVYTRDTACREVKSMPETLFGVGFLASGGIMAHGTPSLGSPSVSYGQRTQVLAEFGRQRTGQHAPTPVFAQSAGVVHARFAAQTQ